MAAALCGLIIGCGSDPAAKKVASGNDANASGAGQTSNATGSDRGDKASPTSGSVTIEDRILKACGDIPKARFAFDSAAIQGEAATSLEAVARCFKTGALAGKGMRIIGHADPRGETEYNLGLGQKRAGSVSNYLNAKGLERGKLETSSRGEMEASGDDEEGWAKDRRVELFLAE
jgi:peptidoglycan-associated lipoprotein